MFQLIILGFFNELGAQFIFEMSPGISECLIARELYYYF